MRRLLAIAYCLSTVACQPIWFSTDNPFSYTYEDLAGFKIDSTSDQVAEVLGRPHMQLQNGRIWVYGRTRAARTDRLGSYQHDYRAILIEFIEDKVAFKEMVHGAYDSRGEVCWSNDLCLKPMWSSKSGAKDQPENLSRKYSAVTSRGADDRQAKLFRPDDGQCAVYVYSGQGFFTDPVPPPVFTIGDIQDEPVPVGGYIFFQSPPKRLQLAAGRHQEEINCIAGSLNFYQLKKYMATEEDDIRITSVSSIDGKKAINKRQRLLTW